MKPDKIIKAFFMNTQVGILIKIKGQWLYRWLIPFIGDPRTMQIIYKPGNKS